MIRSWLNQRITFFEAEKITCIYYQGGNSAFVQLSENQSQRQARHMVCLAFSKGCLHLLLWCCTEYKTDHSVNAVAKLPFADKDSLESIDSVKDLLHVTFVKTYKINWHCKFSFSVGELAEKNPIISIYYNYQIFKVLYTTFCFQKYNILLMHLRRIKGSNCLICWLTNLYDLSILN